MKIEIVKGFPKSPNSLKPLDVFFVGDDRANPYLVVAGLQAIGLTTGSILSLNCFAKDQLHVARSTTLTVEI